MWEQKNQNDLEKVKSPFLKEISIKSEPHESEVVYRGNN